MAGEEIPMPSQEVRQGLSVAKGLQTTTYTHICIYIVFPVQESPGDMDAHGLRPDLHAQVACDIEFRVLLSFVESI